MAHTLIVAVHEGFDREWSTAAQTTRLGYCHGFEGIGVQAELVRRDELLSVPDRMPGPIFWLTYGDYSHMDEATLKMLYGYPHFVQVNTWFDGMEALHARYRAPGPGVPQETLRRILRSEPDFVWSSTPEAYLEFYDGWRQAGMKVVPLPRCGATAPGRAATTAICRTSTSGVSTARRAYARPSLSRSSP